MPRRDASIACVLLCAFVVAGCGEKKGTYARFDDDVTAKSWEAWRDASGKAIYLRTAGGLLFGTHTLVTYPPGGTCASVPMFQVVRSTLRASLASTRPSERGWGSGVKLWR